METSGGRPPGRTPGREGDAAIGRCRDQSRDAPADAAFGPHPMGSYQIAFAPEQFAEVVPWLALNRRGLIVFVHPETGDDLADHTEHAIWMGDRQELALDALR